MRYVVTLDSDTDLPLDAGRKLVGTIAHPLNRPRFDRHKRRVTEGYAVLPPRVAISAVSASRVVPLAASNIPTAWRNSASRGPGIDSSRGGAAIRTSSRGSTFAGRA